MRSSGAQLYKEADRTWRSLVALCQLIADFRFRLRLHGPLDFPSSQFLLSRSRFIFAGQRSKEYLYDFLTYDVDLDRVDVVPCDTDDSKKMGGTLDGRGPIGGTSSPGISHLIIMFD